MSLFYQLDCQLCHEIKKCVWRKISEQRKINSKSRQHSDNIIYFIITFKTNSYHSDHTRAKRFDGNAQFKWVHIKKITMCLINSNYNVDYLLLTANETSSFCTSIERPYDVHDQKCTKYAQNGNQCDELDGKENHEIRWHFVRMVHKFHATSLWIGL